LVDAKDYCISYGDVPVLGGVTMSIKGQGVHAIIGPSGSGKSTFLLAIAGLLRESVPDQNVRSSGMLRVQPECLRPQPDRLRVIGLVFQRPLPFRMSIYENIAVVLGEHRVPKSERPDRVEQALRDAGLWSEVSHRLRRSAWDLSGGQQQRLCLARTLALNPCLLLLDEPCSSLDPVATAQIEDSLGQLAKDRCVVLVTHNLGQARRLSSEVSLFWPQGGGSVCVETSRSAEFFTEPQSPLARQYLEAEWGRPLER
jgi:phosphate transport system ATP-binding protein